MPIQRILTSAPVMIILFLAPSMIGIAKAMIDLWGREFSHGLARGFKRARNHWQVMSDEPTNQGLFIAHSLRI